MNTRTIAGMGLIGIMGIMGARADEGGQSATRQEQIRGETDALVGRLDDFIGEYERNGLASGDDYEALKKVRGELGSLSEDEMAKVVALLGGANGNVGQLAKAYTGQKDISLKLQQILAEHDRELDIAALAGRVRQLSERQAANLSTAIDTKQLAQQDKSQNGQAAVGASEQAQQGEQRAIAGELKLAADKLGQIMAAAGDQPKWKDAQDRLGEAQPQAASAAEALGGGKMDEAVTGETGVREKLDEIARELAPETKEQNVATEESRELTDIAREQRTLLGQTKQMSAALKRLSDTDTPEAQQKAVSAALTQRNSPLTKALAESGITPGSDPDQIRNAPETQKFLQDRTADIQKQQDALRPQLAALAATQAALAAKAQMVREDLQKTAKAAEIPMANALTEMNSAQDALSQDDGDQAAENEQNAANDLDQAEKLAGQAETPQEANASPAQKFQQLQSGVHDLVTKEASTLEHGDALQTGPMAATAAALQKNMAEKAEALEQQAETENPQAAQPLQAAANALQNASQDMGKGGMPQEAQAAQEGALEALQQAGQELQQQAAGVAQQKQEVANLEHHMDALDHLIQEQKQVNTATENAGNSDRMQAGVARQQATVRNDTQKVRDSMNTDVPEAAKPLDHADTEMGEAVQKLDNGTGDDAKPPQQEALAALYKAQDALANRIAKAAADAGDDGAGHQQLANAAAAVARAQQAAADAQKSMAGNAATPEMKRAINDLGQAGRALDQAGTHPEGMPQAARDAIRGAQKELADAAHDASHGQGQAAQGETGQGQQAMEAAQSAMQGAQAGISTTLAQTDTPSAGAPTPGPSQQTAPSMKSVGANEKNWKDQGGAAEAAGQGAQGTAQYIALPERDRAALQQSQSEKYPQEYGTMIEEYMRSLASDAGGK